MSILVQREFRVAPADRAEFERQSREGLWPAFLHFGSFMVAYGTWSFGGESDVVVTHTTYADFPHWDATRAGGAFYRDEAMRAEIAALRPVYADRGRLVTGSRARVVDMDDVDDVGDAASSLRPFVRAAGSPLPDPPPTFGAGSVVAEWTHALEPGARDEWPAIMRDCTWPWLEAHGARLIAHGRDPLADASEAITLVAFRSLDEWHRLAHPLTLDPPADVRAAIERCERIAPLRRGRLLAVGTEFGTRV